VGGKKKALSRGSGYRLKSSCAIQEQDAAVISIGVADQFKTHNKNQFKTHDKNI
jgi:hypothetical protein